MPKAADHKWVLGIVGSPRRHGNTEMLVNEALRGAEEADASVEKVILSKLDVGPCRACDACRKTGECVQRDDMPALLEQMERSKSGYWAHQSTGGGQRHSSRRSSTAGMVLGTS
jgi:hypothetical protein